MERARTGGTKHQEHPLLRAGLSRKGSAGRDEDGTLSHQQDPSRTDLESCQQAPRFLGDDILGKQRWRHNNYT